MKKKLFRTHMHTRLSKPTSLLTALIVTLILAGSVFFLPAASAISLDANSFKSVYSKFVTYIQSSDSEQEPNETLGQANVIAIPGQKTGAVKFGDATDFEYTYSNGPKDRIEDFFKFTVPTGQTRQVDISLAFSGADLDLLLFKREGNGLQAIAVANTSKALERITPILTLGGGEYLIGVSAFDAADNNGQASYTLSVVPDTKLPPPAIAAIAPQAVTAGSEGFSLTVKGANFFTQSVVAWNGVKQSTNFVGGEQLIAFIPASALATAGTANITVINPESLGGTSSPATFTVLPAGTPDLEVEPNETSTQASLLLRPGKRTGNVALGDSAQFTVQLANGASDAVEDMFALNMAEPGRLDVILSGSNASSILALYLLRENGSSYTILGNSRQAGSEQRIITNTTYPAGRYLIGVSAVTGSSPYTIEARTPGDRLARVLPTSAAQNGTVTLPISFQSEGNENTLSFSLKYNSAVLNNPQISLGSDLAGATLNLNTSESGQGRIGVEINLPQGQKLAQGLRQLARVTFGIAPNPGTTSTPVEFTDTPVARIIVDNTGNAVVGTYSNGLVFLVPGYEADVAPRPTGNGDGTITIADWAQIGRFVAGVDIAADGSEYQRADVAPKDTLGDGRLTIADWVMAGRYAAGLDAPAAAGGPAMAAATLAREFVKTDDSSEADQQGRAVRVAAATFNRGQAGETFVELNSLGNENAVGFSVNFDATQLTFTNATLGPDATGAILNVNTTQLNLGRVGIGLALPSGQTFQTGTRRIVRLNFTVPASSSVNATTISFGDQPIAREVVDAGAASLPTTFTAGEVTLIPQISQTPGLTSLSPDTVNVGGAAFTLTVNGSNFLNGAVVRVGGQARVTEFVNASQLRATVLSQDILETGTLAVTVQNPAPSGGVSGALNLNVVNPAPTLTSINPSSAAVGGQAFTLQVTGTNFVPGATIQWNGNNRITTFVSSTQLTAQIPASELTTAGTVTVRVVNPAPGGGPSSTLNFSIQQPSPIPRLTSISPNSVQAGGAAFTLTVNGVGFVSTSVVRINGNSLTTTFVNSGQLTAQVTPSDVANSGQASVTVFNPAPGGGTSNAILLSVSVPPNPVPTIASISPANVTAGTGAFTLTVTGTNFVAGSIVRLNGADRPTTFISATEVRAAIQAGDTVNGGSASITVFNPAPAGGTSNAVTLTIGFGPPTISLVSPVSAVAGGPGFQLTVIGTNFAPGSVIRWNGSDRTTQFVGVTELAAQIPASDIASVGSAQIVVFSPPPGGGTSNAITFQINQATRPVPRITALSPNQVVAGSPGFTLTVTGTNFVTDTIVRWNGQPRPTSFVSSTQLTAQIPASDVATLGAATVTAFTAPAGGGESNPVAFTINQPTNPVPSLSSITPVATVAGGASFVLTVNGTGFAPSSVVQVNGANRPTSFVSTAQLTAQIPASDIAFADTLTIRVVSPPPGGGVSGELTLSVLNPFPTITALTPNVVAVGSAGFTLTVTGTGFAPGAQVFIRGTQRITTYVNSTTLTAPVTPSDVAAVGSITVQVINPQPGGGPSNTVTLDVRTRNPIPRATSISPTTVNAGGSGFTLVVNGTGFARASVVKVNGQDRVTDFVSESAVAAQITAADIASGGLLQITVVNPAPGGGSSNVLLLTVRNPEPRATSVSPDTAVAGSVGFTLIVNGAGFVPSSVVRFNNIDLQTTFITSSQISAEVPASAIQGGGVASVLVINPTPGGGSSNVLTFAITNPASVITSINPTQVIFGGSGFTLTLDGNGFVPGAVVRVNNQDRPTNFVSSNRLTVSIPASDIAAIGTLNIFVVTPPPGGGQSNTVALAVINAQPEITGLDPAAVTAGSIGFPLTVNGNGFVQGAVVTLNGSPRQTTFVNNSRLVAQIQAADVATAGTAQIAVSNPQPGGGTSNSVTFTINNLPNPTPTVTNLNPISVAEGSPAFNLLVNGTNFVPGAYVNWNGVPRSTTFVSTTQVSALILASDVAAQGTATVSVTNPTPGGGTSNSLNFTITPPNPAPTLSTLAPTSAAVGSPAFTLTVNGSGFVPSSVVRWNGSPRPTTFSSSTQLLVQIPASDAAAAATVQITVVNPAPGGGTSNALAFSVNSTPNPVPTLSALSPDSAFAGDDPFTVTVTGSNFVAGSLVLWNGLPRPTAVISTTELRVQISAADVASAGVAQVAVLNPTPGGGTSSALNFTINALNCQTICVQSPQFYALQNASRLPRGSIYIGGVNFNNLVSIQSNIDDVRRALAGGSSAQQMLNQQYVALQLSILAVSGPFPTPSITNSSLRCYGLNFAPLTLDNGVTLSRNTTLAEILAQSRSAILENRTDDMTRIVTVLTVLNGNSPTNRCQ